MDYVSEVIPATEETRKTEPTIATVNRNARVLSVTKHYLKVACARG